MDVLMQVRDEHGFAITPPKRATTEAAGYDLRANLSGGPDASIILKPFQVTKVPTGLRFAPEPGTTILVTSRSGLASRGVIVVNGPGVIDSDYRGEIMVLLMFLSSDPSETISIYHGDRVGQLLFLPKGIVSTDVTFTRVDELPAPDSNRTGGFGSTGR